MAGKTRLYISVFNEISSLIKSGEFPVGSRLPTERELSARFDVSRPTIREAIIALEAKEQVSVKANSGVYVLGNNLATDDFSREISAFELLEARVLMEGEAAAIAQATHNRVIMKQIMYLWDIQENFDHINYAHQSVCKDDASNNRIEDHTAIYDAIAAGNVNEARQAMRSHFTDLLEAMHDASEREAVEETKRKVTQLRQRFTIGEEVSSAPQ